MDPSRPSPCHVSLPPAGDPHAGERTSGGGTLPHQTVRLEIADPDGTSRTVPLDHTPFTIGSAASSRLTLALPGIAEQHAQIILLGGAYHLVPGAGGAPLSVDGIAVPADGVALAHGARIVLGSASPRALRFLVEGSPLSDREDRDRK